LLEGQNDDDGGISETVQKLRGTIRENFCNYQPNMQHPDKTLDEDNTT